MKTNLCFFDDFWIDCRRNVARQWYSPRLAGTYQDPTFDAATYPSLAWCPEAGRYRLWYEALPRVEEDALRYIGVAESVDGHNWTPGKFNTDDPCNRVAPHFVYSGNGGIHGSSVYYDPYEKNPDWRYKCAGMTRSDTIRQFPRGEFPLTLSTSTDGIHWTEHPDRRIYPFTSDTYNCIFYNPVSGKYQVILRASYVDRRICMIESDNLQDWSDPLLIVHPDAEYEDGLFTIQLYSMGAYWNEGLFLGLMLRFHTSLTDEDLIKMNGYMDSELMYSYDGRCWMHTTRRPIVEKPVSPDYGFNQMVFLHMAESPDKSEMILVAAASRTPHLQAAEYRKVRERLGGKLGRFNFYAIRKDGFCGLECCGLDGKVITKSFQLQDDDLTVNVAASTGLVRMAILDHAGRPYEGFSYADSLLGNSDGTAVVPTWQNHVLAELKGKRVRFAFELNSAILYSVRGTFRPFIVRPEVSLSNPRQIELVEDPDPTSANHPF